MKMLLEKAQLVYSTLIGILCAALGGYDAFLQVLIAFVIIDYLSGIAVGIKTKTVSSKTGFNGIIKKIMIFSIVYIAHLIDDATATSVFRNITVMFYVSNEGISILENMGQLGVQYPAGLANILAQLKGEAEDDYNQNTKSNH